MTNILIHSNNIRKPKQTKPTIERMTFKTIQERNQHLTEMLKKYKQQNDKHQTTN